MLPAASKPDHDHRHHGHDHDHDDPGPGAQAGTQQKAPGVRPGPVVFTMFCYFGQCLPEFEA